MDEAAKEPYTSKATEDKARYDRELAAFLEAGGVPSRQPSQPKPKRRTKYTPQSFYFVDEVKEELAASAKEVASIVNAGRCER